MKSLETASDGELIDLLADGDSCALEVLYDRHSRFLYSLALRIMGNPEGAEEVLQDTFLQLWRKSYQFDSLRGSLIGWLLTITRNGAISRIRQDKDEVRCESLSDDKTVLPGRVGSTFLEQYVAGELVSGALATLSEVQRRAITLAYFEGCTCEEIALRTGAPLGTIKARLRSALKTMRHSLSNPDLRLAPKRVLVPPALANVLTTEELLSRICRQRDPQQEVEYLRVLEEVVTASPERLIDSFLQMGLDLCGAGTSGLSFLETNTEGEQIFRWTHLTGKLAKYVGGFTPRNFSPCGVTLDCNAPQLFAYPGRYFHYFNDVDVPIVEGLVIPFRVGESTEGTVWIVSHQEGWAFDSEDVRIMTNLAEVVGCALYLTRPPDDGKPTGKSRPDESAAAKAV